MGIGFAIPVQTARQVLEGLVKDGQVTRGWIGVEPQNLSAELAQNFGLPMREAVVVTGVLQNGPAFRAGIKPGDAIVGVAGVSVTNVSELLGAVAALKPGEPAKFRLVRSDREIEISVTPAIRPKPHAQRPR
jgi:S1-C subfamily serine protease